MKVEDLWIWFIVFLGGMYAGSFLGHWDGVNDAHQEAVDAGVARYTVNPKSGTTTLVYGSKP